MTPLCVDLDGTLIRTDTARLAAIAVFKRNPLLLFVFPFWLSKGLASMKRQFAKRYQLDPKNLPYNKPFLAWLETSKANGRSLYLVSATDQQFANSVAKHLGIFDDVMASDGKINLRAANKRDALDKRFGKKQYDYAGNDDPDLVVWQHVRKAVIVNPSSKKLIDECHQIADVDKLFP